MADSGRACFAGAAAGFTELTGQIPPGAWDRPALGEWNVRDLAGHTSRALSTIESYLARGAVGEPTLDAVSYFLPAPGVPADPDARLRREAAIAQRGRDAGAALGDDPSAAVAALAQRVVRLVEATPGDATLATPAGVMTLAGYLPTRTFELAVHSLDLARALGLGVPPALAPAISASCELAGRLAGRLPSAAEFLLLLTGRTGLPGGLSVV